MSARDRLPEIDVETLLYVYTEEGIAEAARIWNEFEKERRSFRERNKVEVDLEG